MLEPLPIAAMALLMEAIASVNASMDTKFVLLLRLLWRRESAEEPDECRRCWRL